LKPLNPAIRGGCRRFYVLELQGELDILQHRAPRKESVLLPDDGQRTIGSIWGQPNLSSVRSLNTGNDLQNSCLTAAARTDERYELSVFDIEVNTVEDEKEIAVLPRK